MSTDCVNECDLRRQWQACELGVQSRESDLREWEHCLVEWTADRRHREAAAHARLADFEGRREDQNVARSPGAVEAQGLTREPRTGGATTEDAPVSEPAWIVEELDRLRADRAALDQDRMRLQRWMLSLQEEQAILEAERRRLAADRARLAQHAAGRGAAGEPSPAAPTALETAQAALATAEEVSERIAREFTHDGERLQRLFAAPASAESAVALTPAFRPAEYELKDVDNDSISQYMSRLLARARRSTENLTGGAHRENDWRLEQEGDAGRAGERTASKNLPTPCDAALTADQASAPQPRRERPRHNPGEVRAGMTHLRDVANHSTRQSLSRHTWRRVRSTLALKSLLALTSFGLAGILWHDRHSANHALAALGWGAGAIGAITVASLVNTWHQLLRRLASPGAGAVRPPQPGAADAPESPALADPLAGAAGY